ncbi:MAG: histidine kinase N-terminal 7TM domain-containing protein [Halobacteriota archaeon]
MSVYGLAAYAASALVGGVVGIALVTRYDRRQPAFTFGLFVLAMSYWSASYVGYLTASSPRWLLGFKQLTYFAAVAAPVLWFVFVVQYTDRSDWLSRRRLALLSVFPVVVLGFVFTAQFHSLFYAEIQFSTIAGNPVVETEAGVVHSLNLVYSYAILVVGNGLIVGELFTNNRLYRRQSLVLLACLAAPWVANAVFHLGFNPVPTADLTPVAFVASSLPLAVIVQRDQLAEFVPVAHERVFHTLDDPVFVLTPRNRVLDANRAAREVVTGDGRTVVDGNVTELLPEVLLDDGELHPELEAAMECTIDVDGVSRRYVARLRKTSPDTERAGRGYILSLIDVTLQKRQQEQLATTNAELSRQATRLERKNEQLERLAGVISHDLETPLATGETLLHLVQTDLDDPHPEVQQSLEDLETVHSRLRTFAEALPTLARESTDVESPVECDLETVAQAAWDVVDTGELVLSIPSTCTLEGDASRLQQAFENLFQNTVEHGSTSPDSQVRQNAVEHGNSRADDAPTSTGESDVTTVRVGTLSSADGFYVEDDGPGIPADRRGDLLEFGVSTGSGSGYGLAIVRTIFEAHGWQLSLTDAASGGARFESRPTIKRTVGEVRTTAWWCMI